MHLFACIMLMMVGASLALPVSHDPLPGDLAYQHPVIESEALIPIPRERRSTALCFMPRCDQNGCTTCTGERFPSPNVGGSRRWRRQTSDEPQEHDGNVGVQVEHNPGGTNVAVEARQNLAQSNDGNTRLDSYARYSQQFSHGGSSRPDYGVGVRFSHQWG